MKLNLLIFFLLFQLIAFSQKDSILIKGIVTNTESKAVKNAFLHLASSEGHRYEYKTDSTGTYRFYFYTGRSFSCTLTIASDKHTTSGHYKNLGFLASKEHAVFELQPGNTYVKDFTLTAVPFCGPYFPAIFFRVNSIISCNDSLSRRDSINHMAFDHAISSLYEDLKENPGLVIELQSHASTIEKDPEVLSLKRAEYIRQLLIEKSVNGKRIFVKGYGVRKLLVTDAMIKKAKTKEEKMAMHLRNQRVVFRIISFDFKE
jgi:hypothetical protein